MSRKLLIAATLTLNSLMIPYAIADEPASPPAPASSSQSASSDMSKDEWLKAMQPMLPGLICKGFMSDADLKKRFDELKLTYDQCVSMIPESATKCQNQIFASIPDTINTETAGIWGKALGECIGKDFAEQHLIPKS